MADFLAFVADEVQTIDALVDLLAVEHPTPQLFDADAEQLFVVFLDLSSARFVTWKIFVFPFFLIGVVEVILRAAFCGPSGSFLFRSRHLSDLTLSCCCCRLRGSWVVLCFLGYAL